MILVSERTKPKLEHCFTILQKNALFAMERMNSDKPLTDGHKWLFRQLVGRFYDLRRKLIVLAVRRGIPRKEVAEFYGVSLSQVSYAVRSHCN